MPQTAEILLAESCHEQVSFEYGFKQLKCRRISENGWQRVPITLVPPAMFYSEANFYRLYSPLHCLLKVNSITRIPYSQGQFLSPVFPITLSTQGEFNHSYSLLLCPLKLNFIIPITLTTQITRIPCYNTY